MSSSIPAGTTLQNRYRILQLLGQGGFGRTYRGEDLGRFNESCAIKEFEPQQDNGMTEKSLQLFQREATILYNIDHPQIPKFQAIFEENHRLFLVQDYIDGTSYRDLLNQRLAQGMTFSEAEVRQLLQNMLPILAHIHSKGIIHRDISPDNILQRRSDQLPILIDFGVVKEVFTRVQMLAVPTHATSVGKLGYAPSEQMQSGRAYPSSDLYSLAVTGLVLLTGKEPQVLFDDVNLTWQWQTFAAVSPGLTQVLNRAISYRPGDRFQSVSEMAQALGSATTSQPLARPAPAPASQVKTLAVGRPYQPTQVAAPPPAVGPRARRVTAPDPPSAWENPWVVLVIATILALLAGLGGWLTVTLLNRPANQPTPTPEATVAPSPATPPPEPAPAPAVEPKSYDQALPLSLGQSKTLSGALASNETINYKVQAEAGQILKLGLTGEGVLLTVLDSQGEPVDGTAQRVLSWQGALPNRGEYTVQLRPVQGLNQSNYQLEASLNPAPPPDTSTGQPNPAVDGTVNPTPGTKPTITEQRLQIPAGQTRLLVTGQVNPEVVRRYVISARAGQTMVLDLPKVTGPVTLDVRGPSGELIADAARVISWQGQLGQDGDYRVDVTSLRSADYTLQITIN